MTEETFGPYELRGLVGRGGMGEVHRAVDTRKNRGLVALKRLPEGLADDADFQRRFLREAELAARLRDPHVIPIHDYGQIGNRPYLDMRLVDGIDLAKHLERHGPMAPARAVEVIGQVADALDAAHREDLVHRDVKPQNILLSRPDGTSHTDFVYLIDFGIAANLMSRGLTSSGVAGTAAYMAPERFTTGGDHRVDVYALGCVLFELLTGRRPFAGDAAQLMGAHARMPPPRPSSIVAGLPSGLDGVVATAMAKHPDDRHRSAGALASQARHSLVRTQMTGTPTATGHAPTGSPSRHPDPGPRWPVAGPVPEASYPPAHPWRGVGVPAVYVYPAAPRTGRTVLRTLVWAVVAVVLVFVLFLVVTNPAGASSTVANLFNGLTDLFSGLV